MYTNDLKSPNPGKLLDGHETHPIVALYLRSEHMQHMLRRGWPLRGVEPLHAETNAEHTDSVVFLADAIREAYFPELDALKVFRAAMIHDRCEVGGKDIIPDDNIDALTKQELERRGIEWLLEGTPVAETYREAFLSYQSLATPEDRYVWQIDKLQRTKRAMVYQLLGHGDPERLEEFIADGRKLITDPRLTEILEAMVTLRDELRAGR